jgi:hypothetical protein
LALPLASPASAHTVYFKDGTAVRGTVVVKESIVTVRGADSELSFPLDSIRAISFTDEPIVYEQKSGQASGNDWLMWSAVGANVLAVVTAVFVATKVGQ